MQWNKNRRANRTERQQQRVDGLGLEKLEDRVCLTVSATLTPGGSLAVTGDADGLVEIVAVDTETFDVFDNEELVATVEGVTRDIGVRIDQNAPDASNDDQVQIRLGESSVRKISANLGHGNDSLQVSGQAEIARLTYRGGLGDDAVGSNVQIDQAIQMFGGAGADELSVDQNVRRIYFHGGRGDDAIQLSSNVNSNIVAARMGQGDNHFASDGNVNHLLAVRGGASADTVRIGGSVGGLLKVNMGHGENDLGLNATVDGFAFIRGGSGTDTVTIGGDAEISRHAGILLGHGDNQFNMSGSANSLFVGAGDGTDNIVLGEDSRVGNNAGFFMGHGDNNLRIHGEVGNNVFAWGGRGNDDVFFSETAGIGGNALGLLGHGENRFLHAGTIAGDLTVLSKNVDDTFAVTGTVLGTTRLVPGGQGG